MSYTILWCRELMCLLIVMIWIIPYINAEPSRSQGTLTSLISFNSFKHHIKEAGWIFIILPLSGDKLRVTEVKLMQNFHSNRRAGIRSYNPTSFPTAIIFQIVNHHQRKNKIIICYYIYLIKIGTHLVNY